MVAGQFVLHLKFVTIVLRYLQSPILTLCAQRSLRTTTTTGSTAGINLPLHVPASPTVTKEQPLTCRTKIAVTLGIIDKSITVITLVRYPTGSRNRHIKINPRLRRLLDIVPRIISPVSQHRTKSSIHILPATFDHRFQLHRIIGTVTNLGRHDKLPVIDCYVGVITQTLATL